MSTYQQASLDKIFTPEEISYRFKKDRTLRGLQKWFDAQQWVLDNNLSYTTSTFRGYKNKEVSVLIFGDNINIDDIIKEIEKVNFKDLGLDITYKSFEKASWNSLTYFIDFAI